MSEAAIESLESQAQKFQAQLRESEHEERALKSKILRLTAISRYLVAVQKVRDLVNHTVVWRPGVVLIMGTIGAGIGLIIFRLPMVGALAALAAAAASAVVLFIPTDARANAQLAEIQSLLPALQQRRIEAAQQSDILRASWGTATGKLKVLRNELKQKELEASAEYRRGLLLAENWRALRSVEFEQFLERVFLELGYAVETTRVTGDQGVDLVVSHQGKRIAIQVKGYFDSVSNGAIQEAHTGMAYYKCHGCAVITNSRFTRNAIDLADNVGCVLISESSLPDLVRGEVDLWKLCFANVARQQ